MEIKGIRRLAEFTRTNATAAEEFGRTVSEQIAQLNARVSRLEGPDPAAAVRDYDQLIGKNVVVEEGAYFTAGKLVGYTENRVYLSIPEVGFSPPAVQGVLREKITAVFEPKGL